MNNDIRLSVEFFDHPKTVKLQRRLGVGAVICLQRLWIWTAQNRSNGVLSGIDCEDVEIAAKWDGEPGEFCQTLVDLRFIDETDGVYALHDWCEHQEYASKEKERKDRARRAADARWGNKNASGMPKNENSNANDSSELCLHYANSILDASLSNAPNQTKPRRSTTPDGVVVGESTPTGQQCEEQAVDEHGVPSCPHKRIVALYHEFLPELPGVKVWEGARQQNLQARWRERWKAGKYRTQEEGIAYWGKLFRHVSENCDWLMGRVQGRRGDKPFRASLDWIVNASNFAKLIEGRYDNREVA